VMFGHYMTGVHTRSSENLEKVREQMGQYYNKKRRTIEDFKKGELVMLNGRNIRSKGRCKRLEDKMYGPFKVVSVGHNDRYCKLDLPWSWKIHPAFNVSLLEQYRGTNPETPAVEIEADDAGWTIEAIIASGPSNEDPNKHVFLVKWEGFTHEENTWESFENVNNNAQELLEKYYEENPDTEKDKRFGETASKSKDNKLKKSKRKSVEYFIFVLL